MGLRSAFILLDEVIKLWAPNSFFSSSVRGKMEADQLQLSINPAVAVNIPLFGALVFSSYCANLCSNSKCSVSQQFCLVLRPTFSIALFIPRGLLFLEIIEALRPVMMFYVVIGGSACTLEMTEFFLEKPYGLV